MKNRRAISRATRIQTGDYGLCVLREPGEAPAVVFYDDDDGRYRIVYRSSPTVTRYDEVAPSRLVDLRDVPPGCDLVISAALLRNILHLEGGSLLVAGRGIDEIAVKEDLREAGVMCPRWPGDDGTRDAPRFQDVVCSSCGQGFGPGDHGFSHCENHAGLVPHD